MEYDLEEFNLQLSELQGLSDMVVGSPLYVRLDDGFIAASIRMVTAKPHSLVFAVKFHDPFLENNIDTPRAIAFKYALLDPLDCLLREAH